MHILINCHVHPRRLTLASTLWELSHSHDLTRFSTIFPSEPSLWDLIFSFRYFWSTIVKSGFFVLHLIFGSSMKERTGHSGWSMVLDMARKDGHTKTDFTGTDEATE